MRKMLIRQVFLALMFLWVSSGIAFSAPPGRIVSLAPGITEILYDIGLGDRIVAVTKYCDYPPEASAKPKVGGFSNPSLESIVAARPDRVVMTDDGNPLQIFERLENLGIKTCIFKARRMNELPQGIRDMGSCLGVKDQALKRAERIESVIHQYEKNRKTAPRSRFKKVIFVVHSEPLIVAGSGTIIDDAFKLLGLENIASDASERYPQYSMEELISRSPDIIFLGKGRMTGESAGNLIKRLNKLEAVQKGRVYYTSESLYRLTPRVIDGIEEIQAILANLERAKQ